MPKRYTPIVAFTVVMAVVAVAGYLQPAATQETPNRVFLPNAGGKVIFTHQVHADSYGAACGDCHHEDDTPDVNTLACGDCHPPEFSPEWVDGHMDAFTEDRHCARCHHAAFTGLQEYHDEHENYADCVDCHHGPDISPEPVACADCHGVQEGVLGLRDAVHQSCAACHDDLISDGGLEACATCHVVEEQKEAATDFSPCATCHYQPRDKELVPTRMNAYHDGCMGCHEEMGAGPYGAEACNECHYSN